MKHVQAKWYHKDRAGQEIRRIYIHDMEAPEGPLTAENVAEYFRRGTKKASAHKCFDNNSAVSCVCNEDTAFQMAGDNSRSLGYEHAGYARQTTAEWLDDYSKACLEISAQQAAIDCKRYAIPIRRLSIPDLRDNAKGLAGHIDGSKAFGQSDHYDPGEFFPWDYYLGRVEFYSGGNNEVTNLEFVILCYTGLKLTSDRVGVKFWKGQLEAGATRDQVFERIAIADGNPDT